MTRKTASKMSKQSDLRNFFGKRNAETYQEPSSCGCSESDQSKSSKKTSPQIRFLSSWLGRYKWLRCENDLMFCDTCLTAKSCSIPSRKDVLPSKILRLYKKIGPPIPNDGTPIIIKVESQGPPNI